MFFLSPEIGPSCVQQYLGCSACNARHRRIAANEGGRERALVEELELGGKLVRVLDSQPLEQAAKPLPALLLELHGDGCRLVLGITDLDNGIDERAAAKTAIGEDALEAIVGAEDLLANRRVGRCDVLEARHQVGGDQGVLGRVVAVQRAFADACLGVNRVDAYGANPPRIEKLAGGSENALGRGGGVGFATWHPSGNRSVYLDVDLSLTSSSGYVNRSVYLCGLCVTLDRCASPPAPRAESTSR